MFIIWILMLILTILFLSFYCPYLEISQHIISKTHYYLHKRWNIPFDITEWNKIVTNTTIKVFTYLLFISIPITYCMICNIFSVSFCKCKKFISSQSSHIYIVQVCLSDFKWFLETFVHAHEKVEERFSLPNKFLRAHR